MNAPRWIWWLVAAILVLVFLALIGVGVNLDFTESR